ncbi:MAG: Panacea domain-containing protein [Pirellulaceae bacterium]|nr:Panacea domain-containing protein [Pirellulaceae bacterium]
MKEFPFEMLKAVQALGILHSEEHDTKVAYYRLLKLLYIADREYLKETGRPIVGGRDVAMKKGPLSSPVYDLIKGEHQDSSQFAHYFRKQSRLLEMVKDPGRDELSKREIRKLIEVSTRFLDCDDDELGEITHGFEEYRNHYIENTSTPIPLESKIEALGISEHRESILRDFESIKAWKQLVGSAR